MYIKKKTKKKLTKYYSYTYICEDIYSIFILNIEVFLFCSNTYFHDSFTYFYQSSAAFSPFLLYWGVCFFSLFLLQISKVFLKVFVFKFSSRLTVCVCVCMCLCIRVCACLVFLSYEYY